MTWFLAVSMLVGGDWVSFPPGPEFPDQFAAVQECKVAARFWTMRLLPHPNVAGVKTECIKLRES